MELLIRVRFPMGTPKMKKIIFIFTLSFVLNVIWENLHSVLYDNYMGGKITELILLRASLADAIIITVITLPFVLYPSLKKHSWMIILFGFLVSLLNEYHAFLTDRWAYNSLMPIIPFLGTGLTPTIQIGLLGYLTFKIGERL